MTIFRLFLLSIIALFSFAIEAKEFRALNIIAKKRDHQELTKEEINFFIQGYSKGKIPDYQASSLLMAIYLNSMTPDEIAYLTDSMIHSGTVIEFENSTDPIVDKHSTGGVGDKTSLILAPILAALDVKVPMISGRGLGHTGGTLDKLESIPGFNVNQDTNTFKRLVNELNLCLIGQTKDIAPADKKIYALRDVSGSVESIPLIASSIMSKKMAEGIQALVMDIKTGKGAFIKEYEDSIQLGETIINIGKKLGKTTVALVTDMNQPLGMCVGNSLEIMECVQILRGQCEPNQKDLKDLSFALSAQMLLAADKAKDEKEAYQLINKVIQNGEAFRKFKEVVLAQGGNPKALDNFSYLPQAKYKYYLKAQRSGFVEDLDALKIAHGCCIIGSGRTTVDSPIDHSVGTVIFKKVTDAVDVGDTLLEIHYNDKKALNNALSFFEDAYTISDLKPQKPVLIKKILK